jgi:acyl carrier protein
MDEIIVELEGFIAKKILKQPGRSIEEGEALISSGLVDSFSLMDLALFVEDHYHVVIKDTELNAQYFDTLAQLAALIRSRQK